MKVFQKFVVYIVLKWIVFYTYQFTDRNVKWNTDGVNKEGIFLAVFMLLALPLMEILILFFPLDFALKQKGWRSILFLVLVFSLEFIIGWVATNQHFEVWMIVKIVLSTSLFLGMYGKQLYTSLIGIKHKTT